MKVYTAYVERDPSSGMFFGIFPGIPGAYTQALTLEELRDNLKEVLELCLEEYQGSPDELPEFIGLQHIEIAA